jgi:hypothetical protein
MLADKLFADFVCRGVVWKKCKKRMNQGRWTKDLKRTLFLERGGRRETKYHFVVLMLLFWFLILFSTTETISNFYLPL